MDWSSRSAQGPFLLLGLILGPFLHRDLLGDHHLFLGLDILEVDIRVVVPMPVNGLALILDGLLGTEVQTGEALLTVVLPGGAVVHHDDVVDGTDPCTETAAVAVPQKEVGILAVHGFQEGVVAVDGKGPHKGFVLVPLGTPPENGSDDLLNLLLSGFEHFLLLPLGNEIVQRDVVAGHVQVISKIKVTALLMKKFIGPVQRTALSPSPGHHGEQEFCLRDVDLAQEVIHDLRQSVVVHGKNEADGLAGSDEPVQHPDSGYGNELAVNHFTGNSTCCP